MADDFDVLAAVHAVEARLDELGRADDAERLRAAELGSTSGEILAELGVELRRLAREGFGRDPVVGATLVEARDVIDETLFHPPAWFRRLRRVVGRRLRRP